MPGNRPPLWTSRPVLLFFLVGFGVPWVGWTAMQLLGVPSPWREPSALGWVLFLSGDFMSVAGFVAAWAAGGRAEAKDLLGRCFRWRVHPAWWAFALLVPFLWQVAAVLAWSAGNGGVGPIRLAGLATLVAPLTLAAFITGPLGEEAGWRGFLQPRLMRRYSPLAAAVIVGLIWSVWHLPLYVRTIFSQAGSIAGFTFATVCFSILMGILLVRARGSVLLAILFHWSVNVSEGVTSDVFPAVQAPDGALDPYRFTAMGLTTLALLVALVPGWLRRGATEARAKAAPAG